MRVAAVAAAAAPCRSAKAGAQRVMAATAPQRAWGASHAAGAHLGTGQTCAAARNAHDARPTQAHA